MVAGSVLRSPRLQGVSTPSPCDDHDWHIPYQADGAVRRASRISRIRQRAVLLPGEMRKGSWGEFCTVHHFPKFSDVYVSGCLPVALSPPYVFLTD